MRFPNGSSDKESTCNVGDAGDLGSIHKSGRFPGGGNGNLLLCSCLQNSMDSRAWWATAHSVPKGQTPLSDLACMHPLWIIQKRNFLSTHKEL